MYQGERVGNQFLFHAPWQSAPTVRCSCCSGFEEPPHCLTSSETKEFTINGKAVMNGVARVAPHNGLLNRVTQRFIAIEKSRFDLWLAWYSASLVGGERWCNSGPQIVESGPRRGLRNPHPYTRKESTGGSSVMGSQNPDSDLRYFLGSL